MVEEGQRDPEFEAILDSVDPNRFVHINAQDSKHPSVVIGSTKYLTNYHHIQSSLTSNKNITAINSLVIPKM